MERKWVHLLFAMAGLALVFLSVKTTEWVWGAFSKPKPLIVYAASFVVAGAVVLWAWRSEEIFGVLPSSVKSPGRLVVRPSQQRWWSSLRSSSLQSSWVYSISCGPP